MMNARHDQSVGLLVVANYPVSAGEGTVRVNPDQARFLSDLGVHWRRIGLVAHTLTEGYERHVVVNGVSEVQPCSLGSWSEHFGPLRKLRTHLAGLPRLFRVVARSERVYAFLPGYTGVAAVLFARILGRPYGIYVRGGLDHAGALVRRSYLGACRRAAFVLCTGVALRDRVLQAGGAAELVVPMTPYAISDLTPPRERDAAAPVRLLSVGAVSRSKGVFDTIKALRLLQERGFSFQVRIVGEARPEVRQEVERELAHTGLSANVSLEGFVADPAKLREHYLWADTLLFPTRYNEGFPRVVYEAMIFGLAVVVYHLPVVDGFLADGVNSLLVEPGDIDGLVAQVQRLSAEPDLRLRLGARANKDVAWLFGQVRGVSHGEQVARLFAMKPEPGSGRAGD